MSNNNKRLKYVSVPQDNFKIEFQHKNPIDSECNDLVYDDNVNINYPNDDIDYRIKINEICLFSKHNEGEWNQYKHSYKLLQTLFFMSGVFITLTSLSIS